MKSVLGFALGQLIEDLLAFKIITSRLWRMSNHDLCQTDSLFSMNNNGAP